MANGKGFAFVFGALMGVVGSWLAFTEKGKEVREELKFKGEEWYEDSRASVLRKYDSMKESCKAEEEEEEDDEQ